MTGRFAIILLFSIAAQAAEIKGKVTNVLGGESLGRVQIVLLETKNVTTTSNDGDFAIKDLPPGSYTLRCSAVGYRLITVPFSLASEQEVKEFSITLVPDNFRRTDKVEVRGDVFQGADSASVNEINLNSSEIKEASTVFADDPFRAVQALPGVSASENNELLAKFSVFGAPFEEVGVYLDDVLVPSPFHNIQGVQNGASLSLLTSEVVEEMKLLPIAYPETDGDTVGAALEIRTREGSRSAPIFRASLGMADSDFLGEGQLGHSKRGSWLFSARKSYLGYLVNSRIGDAFSDISFYDGTTKLSYDIAPGQNLNLYALVGHTNVEVNNSNSVLTPVQLKKGDGDFVFLRQGWRWSINPHVLLDTHAAYIRQPFVQHNSLGQPLNRDAYDEWVGGSHLVWSWAKDHVLEGGWVLRRLHDDFVNYSVGDPSLPSFGSDQAILRGAVYAQEASTLMKGRIHVLGGLRWDGRQKFDSHPVSPQISVAFQLRSSTQLQFGVGRYNQFRFPDFEAPEIPCLPSNQTFQRSNHYSVAIEQRFGDNIRLRAQVFDRQTDLHMVVDGASACPSSSTVNDIQVQRKYSRGFNLVLQRRSANRLSGWLGYTLLYVKESDVFSNGGGPGTFSPYFVNPEDQRHNLNAFATYRITPTVNVSGKVLYGAGFPVTTGLVLLPGGVPVTVPVSRLGPYERFDLRMDKAWAFKRWKLTLYGEVLNVTNHYNRIADGFQVDNNGQLFVTTQQTLPVTPTAGLVFEF